MHWLPIRNPWLVSRGTSVGGVHGEGGKQGKNQAGIDIRGAFESDHELPMKEREELWSLLANIEESSGPGALNVLRGSE